MIKIFITVLCGATLLCAASTNKQSSKKKPVLKPIETVALKAVKIQVVEPDFRKKVIKGFHIDYSKK